LQSYVANLVIAGVRLISLGQTDEQLAIAELEQAVQAASASRKVHDRHLVQYRLHLTREGAV
jgi:urease accessory protein UreF